MWPSCGVVRFHELVIDNGLCLSSPDLPQQFLATFARRKNAMRKKDGEAGDERHQELKGASRAAV